MQIKDFKYTKKNGEEGDYSVFVLNDGKDYLVGIDLNKLTDAEELELTEIVKKFEEDLKPFMKSFRKFIVENISEDIK
jgi:hypothetical protein